MDIIRLYPFRFNIHFYHEGNRDGSTIVTDALCSYALRLGAVRQVIVCGLDYRGASVAELNTGQTASCTPSSLAERINPHEAVFLTNMAGMVRAAQLRDALSLRIPICGIVHAIIFPDLLSTFLALSHCLRECDRIVVTSTAGQQATTTIINRCEALIKSSTGATRGSILHGIIEKIPFGTDIEEARSIGKSDARDLLCLPQEVITFLYTGRITANYKANLDPLLLAFAALRRRRPDVHCVIAGTLTDAEYASFLRQRCDELRITEHVSFVLNFPTMIRKALYAAADVFVSPVDNVQETFGLSILEAMAAGLPIIASDWSGYRELVIHGCSGFLLPTYVDPDSFHTANAILPLSRGIETEAQIARHTVVDVGLLEEYMGALAAEPNMRYSFGRAARAAVEVNWSWQTVVARYSALWKQQALAREEYLGGHPYAYIDTAEMFQGFPSCTGDDLEIKRPPPEQLEQVMRVVRNDEQELGDMTSTLEDLFKTERSLNAWRSEDKAVWAFVLSLLKAGALHLHSVKRNVHSASTGGKYGCDS